jgi:hypothetical protein
MAWISIFKEQRNFTSSATKSGSQITTTVNPSTILVLTNQQQLPGESTQKRERDGLDKGIRKREKDCMVKELRNLRVQH